MGVMIMPDAEKVEVELKALREMASVCRARQTVWNGKTRTLIFETLKEVNAKFGIAFQNVMNKHEFLAFDCVEFPFKGFGNLTYSRLLNGKILIEVGCYRGDHSADFEEIRPKRSLGTFEPGEITKDTVHAQCAELLLEMKNTLL
jgi:hypothetical protein